MQKSKCNSKFKMEIQNSKLEKDLLIPIKVKLYRDSKTKNNFKF